MPRSSPAPQSEERIFCSSISASSLSSPRVVKECLCRLAGPSARSSLLLVWLCFQARLEVDFPSVFQPARPHRAAGPQVWMKTAARSAQLPGPPAAPCRLFCPGSGSGDSPQCARPPREPRQHRSGTDTHPNHFLVSIWSLE